MYRILFMSENSVYKYVIYNLNNPTYGIAVDLLDTRTTKNLIPGVQSWTEWAETQGKVLFTIDTDDLHNIQTTHPELFI